MFCSGECIGRATRDAFNASTSTTLRVSHPFLRDADERGATRSLASRAPNEAPPPHSDERSAHLRDALLREGPSKPSLRTHVTTARGRTRVIDDREREYLRALALTAIRGARLDTAQVLLDGLTALDPHDVWSARHAAEVACSRGDGERALVAAEAWMQAAPRDAAATRASARALFLLARSSEPDLAAVHLTAARARMAHAARLGDSLAATWLRCRR